MLRFVKWMAPVLALGLASVAMAADTGTVAGTVTGVDGKPAANISVQVVSMGDQKAADKAESKAADATEKKAATVVASGMTDSDGKFTIKEVPAGDYTVRAGGKGVGMARESVSVKAGETQTVSLTLKVTKHKKKNK